jgi:hypothetical protein
MDSMLRQKGDSYLESNGYNQEDEIDATTRQ